MVINARGHVFFCRDLHNFEFPLILRVKVTDLGAVISKETNAVVRLFEIVNDCVKIYIQVKTECELFTTKVSKKQGN